MTTDTFAIGDKVTWTHVSSDRNTMSMNLREGTITAIADGVATVQPPSNKARLVQVNIARLRRPGQRSQITEFVEATFSAARASAQRKDTSA